MHVHGRGFMQWQKTTVKQVMAEAMNGLINISAFMPNTIPAIINDTNLKHYFDLVEEAKRINNNKFEQYIWFGVTDGNLTYYEQALLENYVIGLKIYPLAPDGKGVTTGTIGVMHDSTIVKAMLLAKKNDKVLAAHCDDPIIIARLKYNPIEAEIEYVKKILKLAEQVPGVKIMICHVSCRQSAELILEAQAKGMNIAIELCPQYLWFDNESTNWNENLHSIFYHCFNNLRGSEHRKFLIGLLASNNELVLIDSDTACHAREEKLRDQPGGIPSNQELVPVIITLAIEHKISEARVAQLLSFNHSKFFNIPVPNELVEYKWEFKEDRLLYNNGKVENPWNGSRLYFPILN
jgi:dihydroorotase-like cyclic amidohydrolase